MMVITQPHGLTLAARFPLTTSLFVIEQDVSVMEQEKIDKLMLDMDGTENKCKLTS